MKYFFLLSFFLVAPQIGIAGSNNFKTCNKELSAVADTIKSKTPFKKDSSAVSSNDSLKVLEKLQPPRNHELSSYKSADIIITKEVLDKTDYRSTDNYITNLPFGFVRDLGTIGQPNEVLRYGQGYNNSSYLINGIDITNRLQNSSDLNLLPSESIDFIEEIPLPQGFLYSSVNNISTLNFIQKDFYTTNPYSRIKFYQAPIEEGMFDGIFSSNFGSKLSTFFEITNQSTDPRYSNSDYSMWSTIAKMRYLLTQKININFSYNYSQTNQQLNGGVDADSILSLYSNEQFNEVLFSADAAPVRFSNRYQKVRNHSFVLSASTEILNNNLLELSLYSQSHLTEFRQNEDNDTNQDDIAVIINNNRYETYGAKFLYELNTEFMRFLTINLFEENKFNSRGNNIGKSITNFSSANRITFFPDSGLVSASAFGKYLNYDGENNLGYGADGFINLTGKIKVYGGFSSFEKPRNIFEFIPQLIIADDLLTDSPSIEKSKNNNLEFKLIFKNNVLNFSLGYFSHSQKDKLISGIVRQDSSKKDQAVYFDKKNISLNGFNLNFDFSIWKFLIRSNTSYYFNSENRSEFGLPEFTSAGGIYYIDTLFNSNLKLKTGFNYYSIGTRNQIYLDFEKGISSPYLIDNYYSGSIINSFRYFTPEFQLDFFFAGKIQDRATIYFIFENLFNTQYFIVPYYPKQERGIRFGVAWEFLD